MCVQHVGYVALLCCRPPVPAFASSVSGTRREARSSFRVHCAPCPPHGPIAILAGPSLAAWVPGCFAWLSRSHTSSSIGSCWTRLFLGATSGSSRGESLGRRCVALEPGRVASGVPGLLEVSKSWVLVLVRSSVVGACRWVLSLSLRVHCITVATAI